MDQAQKTPKPKIRRPRESLENTDPYQQISAKPVPRERLDDEQPDKPPRERLDDEPVQKKKRPERRRLTDAIARNIESPKAGMVIEWDREVRGFGIRVTAAGARSWILNYRANGVQKQNTFGTFPAWTAAAAREEAARLKMAVERGNDPLADKQAKIQAPTISTLAEFYRETHLPKKRPGSRLNDELMLKKHVLPRLGEMKVAAVTYSDIAKLHRELSAIRKIMGNRVVSLLSKMFNIAVREGWTTTNPCKGVEKVQETKRERYLSQPEIDRLMKALDQFKGASARAVRLLLLTGARRGEVLGATWDQFDLDAGIWIKPASTTKQRKLHRVPLSGPARQLLTEMRIKAEALANGNPLPANEPLFPGSGKMETQQGLKRFWRTLCRKADLTILGPRLNAAGQPILDKDGQPFMDLKPSLRIHDLRHSFASILVGSGLSLPIVGAMLGHSSPLTTSRYAHLADEPLREAAERVGAVMGGKAKTGS